MKDLLSTQFVSHLNNRKDIDEAEKATVPTEVPAQTTNAEVFDLLDKEENFFQPIGVGSVTYHNPSHLEIVVVNYEKLLNDLPEIVTKNLKRPDYIVFDSEKDDKYIIINELSQGKPVSKRNDAKYQMSNAIKILMEVPDIQEWINKRPYRWCVFSCRNTFPETPEGIADAFGLNGKNLPERIELKFQPITKAGFTAFETDVIRLD